jgi:hypothetical protein
LLSTVILPVPLAANVTLNTSSNISIYLYKDTTRRLLASTITLNLQDISIDSSGQAIRIKTNVPDISDLSTYSVKVDFATGLLITQSGIPFDSITNTFPLSDPTFLSSYYTYRQSNYYVWSPGIIFILIGLAMLCGSYWDTKILNEWLYYEMFLQVVGLMRYARYPISASAFNIMQFRRQRVLICTKLL